MIMTVIISVLVTSIYSQKIGDAFWSGDIKRLLAAGFAMVFMTIFMFVVMISGMKLIEWFKTKWHRG